MPRHGLRCLLLFRFLILLPGLLEAQSEISHQAPTSFPIVPMTVRFQFVPHYFRQVVENDSQYSRVEGLIDDKSTPPWYEIILTEKASGKKVFYCNSQQTVDVLQHLGRSAFSTGIEFSVSEENNSTRVYQIGLRDASGQRIAWRYVVSSMSPEGQPQFLMRPDTPGLVLMRVSRRSAPSTNTTVMIGNNLHTMDSFTGSDSFYGTDLEIAEIAAGEETWSVDSRPTSMEAGEKWRLHSQDGRAREIKVVSAQGDKFILSQTDQYEIGAALARIEVRLDNKGFGLRSISMFRQGHRLEISFTPALPLPAPRLKEKTEAGFTVAEDDQSAVAQGQVSARQSFYDYDEHVDWKFDSPDWARMHTLETGVSVLLDF